MLQQRAVRSFPPANVQITSTRGVGDERLSPHPGTTLDSAIPMLIRRRLKVTRHLKIDELRSCEALLVKFRQCATLTSGCLSDGALAEIVAVKAAIPRCRGRRGEWVGRRRLIKSVDWGGGNFK